MDFMFNDPAMLDHLDFLFKSDNARKLLFYYQVIVFVSSLIHAFSSSIFFC
jgi:hypothetical protein